jgi:preprotein translocase subunit Sss1
MLLLYLFVKTMRKLFALFTIPVLFATTMGATFGQFQRINPYEEPQRDGGVTNVNVIGQGAGQGDAFVNVVRGAINWVLGILAFIALIILLYGGFLMVTASGDEEKYKKGFTILKQAAIGLLLVGIAWFVVSIIFRLVNLVGRGAEGTDAGT